MSEFTIIVLRFAFFALLWIFVFLVAGVLRQDLFGSRRNRRANRAGRRARSRGAQPVPAGAAASGWADSEAATSGAGAAGASDPPHQAPPQIPRELHITSGVLAGSVISLGTGPITLGRAADNTVVLDDDHFTSGHHARIVPSGGQWYVEDLGSTNGTFLGDQRLHGSAPMHLGTPVTIGETTLELRP